VSEQNLADETVPEEQLSDEEPMESSVESPEAEEASGDPGSPEGTSVESSDSDDSPGNGLQGKIDELTSDLQRLQAEYVNYKRRVDRDRDLVTENARVSVLTALFPVLDDFDRARSRRGARGRGQGHRREPRADRGRSGAGQVRHVGR